MLGKGRYAIVQKLKNPVCGDGIRVIEYCESIGEGEAYILKQNKDPSYEWEVMKFV